MVGEGQLNCFVTVTLNLTWYVHLYPRFTRVRKQTQTCDKNDIFQTCDKTDTLQTCDKTDIFQTYDKTDIFFVINYDLQV